MQVLLTCGPLLIFAVCVLLFHMANAAMLPLVAQKLALQDKNIGTSVMSACIVAAHVVMVTMAMLVGAKPEPVEWAKIVPAQMHSEASVSSPSIGSSTPTQVATESTEPQSAKPAPPKANKLHHQSTKPTGRGRLAVAKADHPFGNWAQGR